MGDDDDLSTSIEITEPKAEIEVQLGHWSLPIGRVRVSLSRRHERRRADFFAKLGEIVGDAVARQLVEILTDDNADGLASEFVERAIATAEEKADESHRLALARLVARAAAGDDAAIDAAEVERETIAGLRRAHVRTLAQMNETRPGTGQMANHMFRDSWSPDELSRTFGVDAGTITAVVSYLVSRGAVHDTSGGPMLTRLDTQARWSITAHGQQILEDLGEP